jgi:hypothetical protein
MEIKEIEPQNVLLILNRLCEIKEIDDNNNDQNNLIIGCEDNHSVK